MDIAEVRAMVGQFIVTADTAKREAVIEHIAATGVSVVHACWELFGRAKGRPCLCTPCTEEPMTGDLVLQIIVKKGGA